MINLTTSLLSTPYKGICHCHSLLSDFDISLKCVPKKNNEFLILMFFDCEEYVVANFSDNERSLPEAFAYWLKFGDWSKVYEITNGGAFGIDYVQFYCDLG